MFVFLHFLNCLVQEAQQAVNAVIAQVYSNDTQVIENILLSCMLYNILAPTLVPFSCVEPTFRVVKQVSLAALGQLDELMKDNEKVTI